MELALSDGMTLGLMVGGWLFVFSVALEVWRYRDKKRGTYLDALKRIYDNES